jgi:hypothetical protein
MRFLSDLKLAGWVATVALVAPVAPVAASAANDLVGALGRDSETQLQDRGYAMISSSPAGNSRYQYWWNGSSKNCVRIQIADGRVATTKTVSNTDCGQKASSNDAAAALAVGAAALIGAAALSHKSHHRDDQEYGNSEGYAEFERGYRDGLYNHSYHNYGSTREYTNGYTKGTSERGDHSSYRNNDYYRGGYTRGHQRTSDLMYKDRSYANTELSRRGFARVGEYTLPGGGHNYYYWNAGSRQCVSVNSKNNEIIAINDVQSSHCS